MQVGNSRVKKILMGDKVVYRDSDGWVPLELADGVTGNVMFKDNGDGTASIMGTARIKAVILKHPYTLLVPPPGYKFVSDSFHYTFDHNIRGLTGYLDANGNESQINFTPARTIVSYLGGNMTVTFTDSFVNFQSDGRSFVDFIFFQAITDTMGTSSATALQIGIEKV